LAAIAAAAGFADGRATTSSSGSDDTCTAAAGFAATGLVGIFATTAGFATGRATTSSSKSLEAAGLDDITAAATGFGTTTAGATGAGAGADAIPPGSDPSDGGGGDGREGAVGAGTLTGDWAVDGAAAGADGFATVVGRATGAGD
jgi:hypothetical protein